MEIETEDYLAYFKFEGETVKDGYLDARKSAEALIGIDEIFRFFLFKKAPELSSIEFELPVRTRKGSWETLIPENIGDWIELVLTSGVAYYTGSVIKKMAQNDIGNKGFKDVIKGIVKGIKWIVQIGKHLKTLNKRKFEKFELQDKNGVQFIGIYNDNNEVLYVPKEYLELFTQIPETIFSRLTKLVEDERALKIGFSENEAHDNDDTNGEVSVTLKDRQIFYQEKEDDILFPELVHNQYVELKGHITRGNENSNTIGFAYNNHILTCYPINGNIVEDRTFFFGDCILKGYINRLDKNGIFKEKKPRIAYMEIIENEDKTPNIFD